MSGLADVSSLKVMSVVGARPQFVKLAPVSVALERRGIAHTIVHTGQHYDREMSDVFFEGLRIPNPQVELNVGSGSHAVQTAAIMTALEPVMGQTRPDVVLLYGDTNSTLAGAIVASKLRLPIAHLEAGLRSFNWDMPEEMNRVLTDHCSDLLLAPTATAVSNLQAEGLAKKTVLVGDVMVDVCLQTAASMAQRTPGEIVPGIRAGEYLLATIHRPANTDQPDRLAQIIQALKTLPIPVVIPVHPRLRDQASEAGIPLDGGALRPVAPQPYASLMVLVRDSAAVITDSGGLQKEAYVLGRVCTTVRAETEWRETLVGGWNVLQPDPTQLARDAMRPTPDTAQTWDYGDGEASDRVADALVRAFGGRSR